MEISSSNLSFQISLIDINALRPHEEIIDAVASSLADAIKMQGIVRDPLIIDRDELVILDGMHRYNSLRRLGCRFAPCCLVDYDSPLIKVGSWFRLFKVPEANSTSEDLLQRHSLEYKKQKNSVEHLNYDPTTILLTGNGTRYSFTHVSNLVDIARTAVVLERTLVQEGHHADYLSDAVALESIRSGRANLVIALPVFSKAQIRECGVQGVLLPHKVTRHVMPSRPLRIDIPLSMLTDRTSTEGEANRKFGTALSARHVERKPAGSVVDGRRYEEELLVFSS